VQVQDAEVQNAVLHARGAARRAAHSWCGTPLCTPARRCSTPAVQASGAARRQCSTPGVQHDGSASQRCSTLVCKSAVQHAGVQHAGVQASRTPDGSTLVVQPRRLLHGVAVGSMHLTMML
jgi:hypothetical protein